MIWMKSLILYLLLANLVMNMVPGKQYKQYIRYYIGLVVLVMLAKPVFALLKSNNIQLDDAIYEFGQMEMNESTPIIQDYYSLSMKNAIRKDLTEYEITDISVTSDEQKQILRIDIVCEEKDEMVEKEIKNYISQVYNVEQSRIYVVRR